MKRFCNVMILTLVLLFDFLATVEANFCAFKTYVFHSNGMLTEKWEAHTNIVNMQLMMQEVGDISMINGSFSSHTTTMREWTLYTKLLDKD